MGNSVSGFFWSLLKVQLILSLLEAMFPLSLGLVRQLAMKNMSPYLCHFEEHDSSASNIEVSS